jgi:S1-C subfamily serine protease
VSPTRPVLTVAFAAAAWLAGCGGGAHPSTSRSASTTAQAAAPSPTGGSTDDRQADYIRPVNRVRPSVVEISTRTALGSGVVFDRAGHIVTNAHVVGDAITFEVTLSDGRAPPATLVGAYVRDDLAVIHISAASLPDRAVFADSNLVPVGRIVLAVGNPLAWPAR